MEGRLIYDCFVLNEKRNAIFYLGSQQVLDVLDVRTAATALNYTTIMVNGALPTNNHWAYKLGTSPASVAYGDTVIGGTTSGWVALSTNPLAVDMSSSLTSTVVTVVETDSSNKVIAVGNAVVNIG